MIITPGDEATALASMAGLVGLARATSADARLAYFRQVPPPRVDRHDRQIADTDAEMARIERAAARRAAVPTALAPPAPLPARRG